MNTGPKIVHIETRFVETDAINFRDVVQRLTGKNSSTTTNWVGSNGVSSSLVPVSDHNHEGGIGIAHHGSVSAEPQEDATTDGKKNRVISSMALMNLSFKDFEGLLSDLPSVEELLLL